jgi:adenosylmethionine-8-amino-7-oxononanoate aminotransferase
MIENLIHSMVVCPYVDEAYARITHGKGVYLYDESGKSYIDASAGSAAVSNLGHGIEEIADILRHQAGKAAILPTHAFSSSVVEEYFAKLIDFCPRGFARAWTVTSGTEAVENAIKMALQYQQLIGESGRYKIISRWFSYHGNSIFTLDVGGMRYRRQAYHQWLHNFPHISPAYQYRHPEALSEEDYTRLKIEELIECIETNGAETIAAFVTEPVVGAALGAVPPPKGYFEKIREVCDRYGILLIADEIMTGFGRIGTHFGMEKFSTTPDIIAAGKGMSGGYYPLSAVLINDRVSSVLEKNKSLFRAGHTYSCNPAAAAVGSFVIDYMAEHKVIDNVNAMGAFFKKRTRELLELDIIGDIRGEGLQLGVEIVQDKVTKAPFPIEMKASEKIFRKALQKGVVLYPGKGSVDGQAGDHILITPPLTVCESEMEQIVETLYESVTEFRNESLIEYA